ncbi:MAG: SurA N-terminal domain-containing protein [Spirochaetes bacterium]|nr:SurA N-terminal domain-containing protein [Spirochaetota bacterium]MBU1079290.1 SurA N-terminal domain-containing protein [Spirochaetota bacterium]
MQKRLAAIVAGLLVTASLSAQPLGGTSLGAPLATVKLVKTEVVSDRTFKDDVAKLEKSLGKTLSPQERAAYLDDVINDLLFYQMCERDGIKVSDGEIDTYIAKLRAQRPAGESDQQFSAFLATQGVPYGDLRTYYKKQVLIQRWLMSAKSAEIAAIPPVSIDEVLTTYDLYKSRLVRPDTVKIAFLFYQFKDKSASERDKGADVMKKLSERLAKGESFDVLRLKSQEGGYAASNESVYFEKNDVFISQFGKDFYDMVFSLKDDGAVSMAFETDAGWWIVKRLEFMKQKQLELTDPYRLGQPGTVQDYIGQLLAKQRENEFLKKSFNDLFIKLRGQAEIKIIGKP